MASTGVLGLLSLIKSGIYTQATSHDMGLKHALLKAGEGRRSLKQVNSSPFNFGNQGSILGGNFNFGSLGLNFNSLSSQITAAILSGNQNQASNLIKQGLQSGNTGAVSQALSSASANVSRSRSNPAILRLTIACRLMNTSASVLFHAVANHPACHEICEH